MKKFSASLTIVFTLLFIGCERDSSYPEKEKAVTEKPTASFNVKCLDKKSNLKEILSFLKVNSLSEVSSKVYFDEVINPQKSKNDQVYFVTLTQNSLLKSEKEQDSRVAILEVNQATEETELVSTATNDKQNGKIEIVNYKEEIATGKILIDYNIDKKYAKITFVGDSKGAYRDCVDRRMGAIFEDGTWLDEAEFFVGWPGSLLWILGKCAWEVL